MGGLLINRGRRAIGRKALLVPTRRHIVVVQHRHDISSLLAEHSVGRMLVVQGKELVGVGLPFDQRGEEIGIRDDPQHRVEVAAKEIDVAGRDALSVISPVMKKFSLPIDSAY